MTLIDWWAICESGAFSARKLEYVAVLFDQTPFQTAGEVAELLLPHASHPRLISKDLIFEAYERAARQLLECRQAGITPVALPSDDFPPRLKSIPDPPARLYVTGNAELLYSEKGIALIGTRNPSEKAVEMCRLFGQKLAENAYVTVSGLAVGCDTAGHEGTLAGNGSTVAFLPGSVTDVYPTSNAELAERILAAGGALVSEYPPETKGLIPAHNFISRDRLQSAMSIGVVVAESEVKGGTMHTARFALRQGKRPLACMEHPELGQISGNRVLIKKYGAAVLKDEAELLRWAARLPDIQMTEQLSLNW